MNILPYYFVAFFAGVAALGASFLAAVAAALGASFFTAGAAALAGVAAFAGAAFLAGVAFLAAGFLAAGAFLAGAAAFLAGAFLAAGFLAAAFLAGAFLAAAAALAVITLRSAEIFSTSPSIWNAALSALPSTTRLPTPKPASPSRLKLTEQTSPRQSSLFRTIPKRSALHIR